MPGSAAPDRRDWPAPLPGAGVPPDKQDRRIHKVPRMRRADRSLPIFGDLLSPPDLRYNR